MRSPRLLLPLNLPLPPMHSKLRCAQWLPICLKETTRRPRALNRSVTHHLHDRRLVPGVVEVAWAQWLWTRFNNEQTHGHRRPSYTCYPHGTSVAPGRDDRHGIFSDLYLRKHERK